jgi:hypothetical protein
MMIRRPHRIDQPYVRVSGGRHPGGGLHPLVRQAKRERLGAVVEFGERPGAFGR